MRTIAPSLALAALISLHVAPAGAEDTPRSPEDVRPIAVGTPMPDAAVRTAGGEPLKLRSLVGPRPLLLVFYRGGW